MKLQQYMKQLRKAKGFSQRQLAQMSGVSNTEIWRIEKGEREKPSPQILKNLALPLGVAVEDLLGVAGYLSNYDNGKSSLKDDLHDLAEQQNTEIKQTDYQTWISSPNIVLSPVVEKITAGPPLSMKDQGQLYPLNFAISGDTKLEIFFYFKVRGINMEPTMADGDIVLVRKQSYVENGKIAVLLCNDYKEAVIRRVTLANEYIILNSDNHKYLPVIKEKKQCRILGKVIKKISLVI